MRHPVGVVLAVAVAFVSVSGAAEAANLDARVAYSLKKVGPALDKAENVLRRGDVRNAKVYLESAQSEWDMIHKDFKGQFDENHPDIVAAGKRLKEVAAKIAAAGGGATAQPTPAPAAPTERLNPNLAYFIKNNTQALGDAEKSVANKNLRDAETVVNEIETTWNTQKKWEAGKFNPKHPEIVAFEARIAKVKAAVSGLGGEAAGAAENLPAVLKAIESSSKELDEAYNKARAAFRDLSSLRSSVDAGQEQDLGKLRTKMDEIAVAAEDVNALLPGSIEAVKAFRKQFPDFDALKKLVPDGWQATQSVERLEEYPELWLGDITREVKGALDEAEKNIKMYGLDRQTTLSGGSGAVQANAADSADKWVVQYAALLIDWIDMGLPELSKENQTVLPEFVKARREFLARAEPMKKNIGMVSNLVVKARKDAVDAARRELEQARFPKSQHTGAQWAGAEKDIRAAWAKKIPDKQLLKVSIYAPWKERAEARWVNDHWVVNTYRYIGANCLAKLSTGKHMVYRMRFRNTLQADGKWSPLEQFSVGHVYEILAENIDK